jgi:hypothetical protein
MENIQASLPPSIIKKVVKAKGFNTTIIGAYVRDNELFVMYNGLTEFIIPLNRFSKLAINNGVRVENGRVIPLDDNAVKSITGFNNSVA